MRLGTILLLVRLVLFYPLSDLELFTARDLNFNPRSSHTNQMPPERTFLAWLRTSLAFASIGIAITQLFRLNTTINERDGLVPANPDGTYRLRQVGKPLGATFLAIAIVVLLVGGRRYFESQVCASSYMDLGVLI